MRLAGAPGEALRAEAGADPQPRTPDRAGALFGVLSAASFGQRPKEAAWRTLNSELAPEAMLAELHAQELPRSLAGALAELLTAAAARALDRRRRGGAGAPRARAARPRTARQRLQS